MFRSCEGAEPGRRSGSPCLDYYIKRCEAPCVGYVSREDYRAGIDGVIAFLSGRYREIERRSSARCATRPTSSASRTPPVSATACARVRSLLERQRVANESVGTLDAIAVAVARARPTRRCSRSATGCSRTGRASTSTTRSEGDIAEVAEAFILQYYSSAMMIPPLLVVQRELVSTEALPQALSERRGHPIEIRAAERGDKRRILELAERNARLALDQEKLRSERRRQQRVEALDGLQQALGLDTIPLRIECFDISHADGDEHGRVDGGVRGRGAEEVRLPPLQGARSVGGGNGGSPENSRQRILARTEGPDDFAAMEEILGRRFARWEAQRDVSPHDKEYDPGFAALPNVVVIDGGKGQLSAGLRALQGFRDHGVTVISLAKRIEEVFIPGRPEPLRLAHDTPELQLLQRVRDEAHRFAITHHRIRRDRAMTASILDELPGRRPRPQAGAAEPLRLARRDRLRLPRGARSGPGSPASWPARSTASSTRPASDGRRPTRIADRTRRYRVSSSALAGGTSTA